MPTEAQWREIDEAIFAKERVIALHHICAAGYGTGLLERLELIHSRYRELRAKFPERFSESDVEYWEKVIASWPPSTTSPPDPA